MENVTHDYVRHGTTTLFATLGLDNYATHKHARVKAWLAKRHRYHIHYDPAMRPDSIRSSIGSASFYPASYTMGLVLLRQRADRKNPTLLDHYNRGNNPFVWTASAESILAQSVALATLASGATGDSDDATALYSTTFSASS